MRRIVLWLAAPLAAPLAAAAAAVVTPAGPALAATGVVSVNFSVTREVGNDPNSTWLVDFTTSSSGSLATGSGTITIYAPTGTTFPAVPSGYRINGRFVLAMPTGGFGYVTITTPVPIAASSAVSVEITGVVNPPPASYTASVFALKTSADTTPVNPAADVTFIQGVRGVLFSARTAVGGAAGSTWTAAFRTSVSGALSAGTSTITLYAPSGTVFPSSAADYEVNGTAVAATPTQGRSDNVTLKTPVSIGNGAPVIVQATHVTNPAAGVFMNTSFAALTSSDSTALSSYHDVVFTRPQPAGGLTFLVNTTADSVDATPGDLSCADSLGRCSLRAALQEANADTDTAATVIVPAGTYALTLPAAFDMADGSAGSLAVTTPMPLTIEGAGSSRTIIDGGGNAGAFQDRPFLIGLGAQVDITGLAIRDGYDTGASSVFNGSSATSSGGGGIANYGDLTLSDSVVSANTDTAYDVYGNGSIGGGIYSDGTLHVVNSTINANEAMNFSGGGVDCDAACTVTDSAITANTSGDDGGGIDVDGSLSLTGSLVSANTSQATGGGGIGCYASCRIVNSTITGNAESDAAGQGGGIFVSTSAGAVLQVSFSTIAGNTASTTGNGGGIYRSTGSSALVNGTIISSNGGGDCSTGAITTDNGYNLASDGTCGLVATGDQSPTDPQLGPLQNNGGPTETMAPKVNTSPVVDKVPAASCDDYATNPVTTDQRGFARPVVGRSGNPDNCDIGAVELGSTTQPATPYSAYHPLVPARICDTRPVQTGVKANQCNGGTLGPMGTLIVHVAGFGAVPTAGATAAVLNVTATGTSEASWMTVWPADRSRPLASSLNWSAGESIPNLVTVALSASGDIELYNYAGSVDAVIDVEGYYSSSTYGSANTGGLFNALKPVRICDTRPVQTGVVANQCNHNGGGAGTLAATTTRNVTVAGKALVPATGAGAVVLNVTAIGPTGKGGYLTIWPAGKPMPLASNLNFSPGQTIPNRVVVPLGAGGAISIYNYSGDTDVAVDVNGWFADGSASDGSGLWFRASNPLRICDTRKIVNATECHDMTLTGGTASGTLDVQVGANLVPAGASAVVANVTATGTTANGGYLTVYPANLAAPPVISDLNWSKAVTIPNMTVTKLGPGQDLKAFTPLGSVDVIVDVDGWYVAVI